MRPPKCAWTLVNYKKTQCPTILPISACPGNIYIPDEDDTLQAVSRYDGKISRDYLGVRQRVDSSEVDQISKMMSQVEVWNQQMRSSKLYREYNMRVVLSRISRSLQYPLPALSLTESQCKKITNNLYTASLPKFGIVSSFPIERRYLPFAYQGLQLPDLYIEQDIGRIDELLQASVNQGICWDQMVVGIEAIQIEIGSISFPFNENYSKLSTLIPSSWYTSLWKFLSKMDLNIQCWQRNIPLQREKDREIMMGFVEKGYSTKKLKVLNNCRKYLQVFTLSDIVPASGTQICPDAIEGLRNKYRSSPYKWKKMNRPYEQSWSIWKEALRDTFCSNCDSNSLVEPLVSFNCTPALWKWFYSSTTDCVYYKDGGVYKKYAHYKKDQDTRLSLSWYKLTDVVKVSDVQITQLASISSMVDGIHMITLEGTLKLRDDPLKNHDEHDNLFNILQRSHTPNWIFHHQR